jgi:hypothetical protein
MLRQDTLDSAPDKGSFEILSPFLILVPSLKADDLLNMDRNALNPSLNLILR